MPNRHFLKHTNAAPRKRYIATAAAMVVVNMFSLYTLAVSGSEYASTDVQTPSPTAPVVQTPSNTPRSRQNVHYAEQDETHAVVAADAVVATTPVSKAQQDPTVHATQSLPETTPSTSLIKESIDPTTNIITTESGEQHPNQTYSILATTPNDPLSGQWWEQKLQLSDAWDIGTGSNDTLLAIIDTGFALDHEEFSGRWHENSGESGPATYENSSLYNCSDRSLPLDQSCNLVDENYDGILDNESGPTTFENSSMRNCSDLGQSLEKWCNLVDDDGNGFVDDVRGWDFINSDRNVQAGEADPYGSGTRHGTYVASVAAANSNNGVGIAGVNWHTQILPIQALGDSGYGTSLSVARSIRYAVDQGADVISLSLGSSSPDVFIHQTITEAVAQGVIVVAASGNDGCECISYPANYDEVIAVGALTHNDVPASFSSYGSSLDIMAPGVDLTTASWSPANGTSLYANGIAGTSLATPLVSGALTLLKSHMPEASNQQLLAALLEHTNKLSLPYTTERSDTLGFGALSVLGSSYAATTPVAHTNSITLSGVSHGTYLFSPPLESSGHTVYACTQNNGSTTVYKLTNGSDTFYSSSQSEHARAQEIGYSSTFVGYFCAHLPHDTTDTQRDINPYLEFDSALPKNGL